MKDIYFNFINGIFSQFHINENEVIPDTNKNGIQITPIKIREDYAKEWNEHATDFVCITKNGELLNPTLYRIGGLGTNKINGKKYFMLLKYVESIYSFDFIKGCYPNKSNKELKLLRKHLEGRWCIIDEFGKEKVEFEHFNQPYLIDNSCIYSLDSKYYNIETKEFYCQSYSSMKSEQYLFLENRYDNNKEKRGVLKINKITGEFELFK